MADIIFESAKNFQELKQYEYRFVVSRKRKTQQLKLDFRDSDFYHIVGLQYLKDIEIPRNRKTILKEILDKKTIQDETIKKSRFYNNSLLNCNVQSRIDASRFLSTYLEINNLIFIYSLSGRPYIHSHINADYIIESRLPNSLTTVYILLKQRKEDEYYSIVSFFPKGNISYGGDALYWMLKEKRNKATNTVITLYKNENYNEKMRE